MNSRKGIIGGGNLIVDYIKMIDYYPQKNMMCNIKQDPLIAVGGCPHNVLIDLAKFEVDIPLFALGLIGTDKGGDSILEDFKKYNISTEYIERTSDRATSFTDCMIETTTGDRTFFHYGGANGELGYEQFIKAANESSAKIFHLANLLHLDKLDSEDPEFGLLSAKVLNLLVSKGFKTSVDLVSVKSNLFSLIVKYCLKYINYLIINEIEAESLSGLQIRLPEGGIDQNNLQKTGEFLIQNGVMELVVIHYPEGGYAIDKTLKSVFCRSYKVEGSDIKSSVGAGDAFCAGVLYSLHENLLIEEGLKIGCASARFNLFNSTATGGAVPLEKIKEYINSVQK
jgi:sugar/nucleoside kinase (ribokinase family)